jgi:tyrosine-protein kinase Etk/Wzc
MRQGLRVTRPQTNAGIVSVAYRSTDPVLAAEVVNGVASSYIGRRNEGQKQQYRAAVAFLRTQVQAYGAELARAESALEQFSRANSVINPEAQAGDQVRRLADLRVQKEELVARQSELWDLVRRTRQPAESTGDWATFMGSPALLQNQAIGAVVQQLSMAEAERARLMTRRTAADPDVVGLDRTIAVLRFRLSALAAATLQGLDDQARSLERTLSQSGAQLARVPEVQLRYARLRRQVDLDTQLYTMLQTRLNESQISEAMEIANVQLVDPAMAPMNPLAARRVFNLMFGSALALLCGIIVAVVRESNDTSVRSRAEMVRLTEVPLLAAIPRIETRNSHRKQLAGRIEDRLVIRHSPRSPAAEAYRALRTNVAFATNGAKRQLRTLVVTSPEPEDGKTTTALNLAVTLADQGLKTVLVAADQRRPVLHKVLHTERAPGLSDLLSGTTSLEQAIRYIPLTDLAGGTLAFIPAGHHVSNPAELLGSVAMKSLLETLAERFDSVILDTPPLCVVTDAAVLGTLADGVLVVARMGSTHSETLQQTVEEIRGLGAHVVGTVLTDVNQREDRYGYRYGYYEYYYEEDGNGNGRQESGRGSRAKNRLKQGRESHARKR